jgi:glycosyltransferase involved in cell wall biosynthesis
MSNQMIKVLVPTEKFWPEYAGWIHQTLLIAENSPDYSFISVSRPAPGSVNGHDLPANVNLMRKGPEISKKSSVFQILYIINALWYIWKTRSDYDLIFLPYSYYPGFLFMAFGKLLQKPVIARVSGKELDSNSVAAKARYILFKIIDQIIVLNKDSILRLVHLGVDKSNISLIPNGVKVPKRELLSSIDHSTRNEPKEDSKLTILFAGLICKRKGVEELIDAFNKVNQMGYPCKLLLAGPIHNTQENDKEYSDMIISKAKKSDHIQLLGNIQNIADLYSKADLFVLPSYSEGMPNSLLEAMSYGLPSIATNIAGVNDVIRHMENGILVEPGDSEALAQALYKLVSNHDLRVSIGKKGYDSIDSNYSIERTSEMYKNLFSRIAG